MAAPRSKAGATWWIRALSVAIALLALTFQIAPGDEHLEWSFSAPPHPEKVGAVAERSSSDGAASGREHTIVQFPSGIETLTGRLFYPSTTSTNTTSVPPPVVVLAHGFGLTQDCALDRFVKAFVKAGFAAFTFDYATFGSSTGLPRQQVHPSQHVADLKAALNALRERSEKLQVDTTRLALWGTSLGGGHVLNLAAEWGAFQDTPSSSMMIRAVVAQVPALASGAESVLLGTLVRSPGRTAVSLVKVLAAVVKWLVLQSWNSISSMMGRQQQHTSWYLPLIGQPGSAGLMQNEGDFEGYSSLIPAPNNQKHNAGTGWKNAVTVPSALRVLVYRPLQHVHRIRTPTLLIAAERDTLCPTGHVEATAQRIRAASNATTTELLVLPGAGHFDVYHGDALQKTLTAEIAFLQKHLQE